MKKTIVMILSIAILTLWSTSIAANSLGARIGLNYGNASTNPPLFIGSRAGLIVGGLAEIKLTSTFYLQGEALYVEKKAKFDIPDPGGGTGVERRTYKYTEFPVSLKAKFGKSESIPYLFIGPNIGLNVSAKSERELSGLTVISDLELSTEDFDLALDFGGGIEYPYFERISILLDIRYSIGLFDIDRMASQTWRTSGLQMILGIGVQM